MVMTTIDKKEHGFKRRIAAEALTDTAIQEMKGGITPIIERFCEKMLDERTSVPT